MRRLYREATIEPVADETGLFRFSVSSEEPYERSFGLEILGHGDGEVDLTRMSNKAALLLNHDMDKQIGVIERAWVDRGRLEIEARFSRSPLGQEIKQDVEDGIRTKTSIGYEVRQMEKTGVRGDLREYRVTDWLPFEASVVSVPADDSVGFGRSLERDFDIEDFDVIPDPEDGQAEILQPAEVKQMEDVKIDVDVKDIQAKARKEEKQRVAEILALGDRHGMKDAARAAVDSGEAVDYFRVKVLESIGEIKKVDTKAAEIGMSEKEKKNFSILRAIAAIAKGDFKGLAPFEYEASQAVEKKLGRSAQGFFLPDDVANFRDITVGSPASPSTGGGNLVAVDLMAQSFIDLLRAKMVLTQLGATYMTGLQGDVAIPKMAGASTAYWVAENNAVTESTPTFGQVTMNPKTVGTYVDLSRHFIKQSSLDAEMLVRNDMAAVLARAIELAAIQGGGSNQPTGILGTSGIGDVSPAGIPTYAEIVELWSDVASSNADLGALGFLTHPTIAAKLMTVFSNATYGEIPVWMGGPANGTMLGYPALVSSAVPTNLANPSGTTGLGNTAVIFGNWNDLLIGSWSGIDINVDTASLSTQGAVRVVALTDVDVAVRHAASFSAMKNARVSG